ncbi:hypothetical protein A5707_01770 [Mycobacterium kyorinense]|uniref:Uncharacterized protein n=1 Tax=Mycobacterium kyorinense TaxID=487514 RepID=A0A1A2Z531_9MYCO|nr:hypothetical protein A5707_01770 [Mycobacterium kyorinense]
MIPTGQVYDDFERTSFARLAALVQKDLPRRHHLKTATHLVVRTVMVLCDPLSSGGGADDLRGATQMQLSLPTTLRQRLDALRFTSALGRAHQLCAKGF